MFSTLKNRRVLIVDDNATNRFILEQVLLQWGMKPTCTENGYQALKELNQAERQGHSYDLILLDAMMPEMDGFTLAKEIKIQQGKSGSTMMLSSADQQGDVVRGREIGIESYMTKPIDQNELLDAICTVFGEEESLEDSFIMPAPEKPEATREQPTTNYRILVVEDQSSESTGGIRIITEHGTRSRPSEITVKRDCRNSMQKNLTLC